MARSSLAGMSCLFCEVVAGRASATRIYENEDYLAILDIRPFTRGHTLVFPKRHTVDLTDTPPETCAELVGIGQRIARAARASSLNADGNNVLISDGRAAFQSVMHIHLHVVPRRNGDKLSLVKGMMLRRDPNLETTGRILREALKNIDTTG
jgi:histidine triad (HIT) family protein